MKSEIGVGSREPASGETDLRGEEAKFLSQTRIRAPSKTPAVADKKLAP